MKLPLAKQPERGVYAASTSEHLPGLLCRESAVISTLKRFRKAGPRPDAFARQQGVYLIECIVYIAMVAVVLGIATAAFFRCWDDSKRLRRNAEDIVRALHAGEQWRADLRTATGPVRVTDQDGAETVVIPAPAGQITYLFAQGELHRQARPAGPAALVLDRVKASRMAAEPRRQVTAWRWELELQPGQKYHRVTPLFSFETVAGHQPAP
jgi:Tfp pilus assembly protein FimT